MSQPHDEKLLNNLSNYAAKKEREMQKISKDFSDMGDVRLFWDSKVPEKNKTFYNFCLSSSDRDDVLEEIKKYQDFYNELGYVVNKILNSEEQTDNEKNDPYLIIYKLFEKLEEMAEAAKFGRNTTASSTVYDLHGSFIQEHEKLENMIKRVECVSLKEGLKKATQGWQESVQGISHLQNDLKSSKEKYDRMCERFDRLILQNEITGT